MSEWTEPGVVLLENACAFHSGKHNIKLKGDLAAAELDGLLVAEGVPATAAGARELVRRVVLKLAEWKKPELKALLPRYPLAGGETLPDNITLDQIDQSIIYLYCVYFDRSPINQTIAFIHRVSGKKDLDDKRAFYLHAFSFARHPEYGGGLILKALNNQLDPIERGAPPGLPFFQPAVRKRIALYADYRVEIRHDSKIVVARPKEFGLVVHKLPDIDPDLPYGEPRALRDLPAFRQCSAVTKPTFGVELKSIDGDGPSASYIMKAERKVRLEPSTFFTQNDDGTQYVKVHELELRFSGPWTAGREIEYGSAFIIPKMVRRNTEGRIELSKGKPHDVEFSVHIQNGCQAGHPRLYAADHPADLKDPALRREIAFDSINQDDGWTVLSFRRTGGNWSESLLAVWEISSFSPK